MELQAGCLAFLERKRRLVKEKCVNKIVICHVDTFAEAAAAAAAASISIFTFYPTDHNERERGREGGRGREERPRVRVERINNCRPDVNTAVTTRAN